MASLTSNRAAVTRAYHGLADAFNLRRSIPGVNKRLGDELIDTAAAVVELRTVDSQQDPQGRPLRKLKRRTIERKEKAGLDTRILIETHEMLSPREIRGRTTIGSHYAVMQAGTTEDVQNKVEWAHEGGPHRPKREFYELGREGERETDLVCDRQIVRSIKAAEQA